jgi:hypothetical protein
MCSEARTHVRATTVEPYAALTRRDRNFSIWSPFIPIIVISETRIIVSKRFKALYKYTFARLVSLVVEFTADPIVTQNRKNNDYAAQLTIRNRTLDTRNA